MIAVPKLSMAMKNDDFSHQLCALLDAAILSSDRITGDANRSREVRAACNLIMGEVMWAMEYGRLAHEEYGEDQDKIAQDR